jgi:hypothetical protein
VVKAESIVTELIVPASVVTRPGPSSAISDRVAKATMTSAKSGDATRRNRQGGPTARAGFQFHGRRIGPKRAILGAS